MTPFLLVTAVMAAAALLLLVVPVWRTAERPAGRWFGIAMLSVLISVGSLGTYLAVSTWQWDSQARAELAIQSLRTMAADAERGMAMEDNLDGWRSLGEFYMGLQEYEGAARAYARAYELVGPQDVALSIAYAEALAMADPNNLSGKSAELLDAALRLQPDNPRALWYGGLSAFGMGRWQAAEQRWSRLLQLDPPAPLVRLLEERLTEIRAQLAFSGEVPVAVLPGDADTAASNGASSVEVEVSLARGLDTLVGERAVLFVILRAGQGGPPLAVQRLPAGAWPASVRITDRDVMLPGQRLADVRGALSVVARISQAGDVAAASGDLQGEGSIMVGEGASILIDRVIQ
jgi:cytochrome c-type biogenesis protein CcmH